MRNYADVPNLHTRIYAMKSRLYSLHDYAVMIREPETIPGNISGIQDSTEAKEILFRQQIAPIINLARAYESYTPLLLPISGNMKRTTPRFLSTKRPEIRRLRSGTTSVPLLP